MLQCQQKNACRIEDRVIFRANRFHGGERDSEIEANFHPKSNFHFCGASGAGLKAVFLSKQKFTKSDV